MAHYNPKRNNISLPKVGEILDAEVFKITDFGAFVKLPGNRRGLIHISQVANIYVKNVSDHLKVGDRLKARVVQITRDGKIDLSLKTQKEDIASFPKNKEFRINTFEQKIDQFLKQRKRKDMQPEEDLEAV